MYLDVIRTLAIALTGFTMMWVAYDTLDTMATTTTTFLICMSLVVLALALFTGVKTYKEFNNDT